MSKIKTIAILTLLAFAGAGFSVLDDFDLGIKKSAVEAAKPSKKAKKKKDSDQKKKEAEEKEKAESELLEDNQLAKSFMPEIFRCPDCGYEQDQEGYCPDHSNLKLIKIISKNSDPLAPAELDGNEDILVDVPLNIQFKKDEIEKKESEDDKDSKKKDSKNKKESNKESSKDKKKSK